MKREVCLLVAGVMLCGLSWAQQAAPIPPATTLGPNTRIAPDRPVAAEPEAKQAPQPPAPAASSPSDFVRRISAGDLLEVRVFDVSDLNRDVRVSDPGEITMPLVGAIKVAGLTVEQAQASVERALVAGNFLKNAHVSIFVREYALGGVSVLGQVEKPGVYNLPGARRLFDAIASAGGLSAKAGNIITITHRDAPDAPQTINFSEDPAKSTSSNVLIQPGDTVVVSKADVVYVVGEVTRPGGYTVPSNRTMTVLQAIALAEGIGKNAAVNQAKILRKSSTGVEEIKIPLKSILAAKAQDVALKGEDIVFLPNSAARSAGRKTVDAALQAITGIAMYSSARW